MNKSYTMNDLKRDIESVLDYNWDDEEKDIKQATRENGPQPGHIFHVLKRLNKFVQ